MKIKLNEKGEWKILEKGSKEGIYINEKLWKKIKNVFKMQKKNWDMVILIDGKEGTGKSTLGLCLAWIFSNEKLTIEHIAEGTLDAMRKLESLPDESVLVIDEGSLLFDSKSTMRAEQKRLVQVFNVIRQKRMILLIIAPSFFDLNKYIAVHRSRFLLHVYTSAKLDRGRFAYFGESKKSKLYPIGKKNYNSYSRPRADFTGTFTDFELPFHDEYIETKRKSLFTAFNSDAFKTPQQTEREVTLKLFKQLYTNLEITIKELARGFGISSRTGSRWLNDEGGMTDDI